jgi:hypothetical protein
MREAPSKPILIAQIYLESLEDLLAVIGEEQKGRVISGEAALILKAERLSYSDAAFLTAMGRIDDAEAYIRSRKDQLDGYSYRSLLRLAEISKTS